MSNIVEDLNIQLIEKDKIKPFKDNPRTHSNEQIEQIANSIKEFGFRMPIAVDENFTILAGHGRYMAALKLKMNKLPIVQHKDLTEIQKKAFIIADNKLTLNSNWDYDLLWQQVKDLNGLDFDLDILGFDESEILPMIDTNTVRDISGEWDNMPDFTQGDKTPDSTIFVHFTCDEDRQKFATLINQPVTEKTKTLWFPPQETMDTKNKIYE